MDFLSNLATGFNALFDAGATQFMGWVTGILPKLIVLMTAIYAFTKLVGEKRVEKAAYFLSKNTILRYTILPFLACFFLTNPMCYTFGRFVKEEYKPAFSDSTLSMLHYPLGVFPHINAGEIFTWMGIASGVMETGVNINDLAIRYLLLGFVVIFVRGYSTELMFKYLRGKSLKSGRRCK